MFSAASPDVVPPKRRLRAGEYVAVVVTIGVIALAAWNAEPLMAYFRLHLWDRDAPGKVVVAFLQAGKSGDQAATSSLLASDAYKPLTENGKWAGYYVVSQGGRLDIPFSDLLPAGE